MAPELPIESFETFTTHGDHPGSVVFDRCGMLWSAGEAGRIYRIDSQQPVESITALGGFCGGLAFLPVRESYLDVIYLS